jgi:hypothetical protein
MTQNPLLTGFIVKVHLFFPCAKFPATAIGSGSLINLHYMEQILLTLMKNYLILSPALRTPEFAGSIEFGSNHRTTRYRRCEPLNAQQK